MLVKVSVTGLNLLSGNSENTSTEETFKPAVLGG